MCDVGEASGEREKEAWAQELSFVPFIFPPRSRSQMREKTVPSGNWFNRFHSRALLFHLLSLPKLDSHFVDEGGKKRREEWEITQSTRDLIHSFFDPFSALSQEGRCRLGLVMVSGTTANHRSLLLPRRLSAGLRSKIDSSRIREGSGERHSERLIIHPKDSNLIAFPLDYRQRKRKTYSWTNMSSLSIALLTPSFFSRSPRWLFAQ